MDGTKISTTAMDGHFNDWIKLAEQRPRGAGRLLCNLGGGSHGWMLFWGCEKTWFWISIDFLESSSHVATAKFVYVTVTVPRSMPCNGWLHSEASELPSPGSGSGSGSTTRSIVAIKQACTDSWGFQGRPAIARGNLLDRVSFLEGGREGGRTSDEADDSYGGSFKNLLQVQC